MSNYSPEGGGQRVSGWRAPVAIATLLAGLLPAGASFALPEDRDQPIQITADTAIRDEKQGVTVYTGNVHMIQGSLDIVADTITIFHETAQADKIAAEGKTILEFDPVCRAAKEYQTLTQHVLKF